MKKRRTHLILLAIGTLLISAGLTMAQGGPRQIHGRRVGLSHQVMNAVLDPTPEQKDRIRVIRQSYHPRMKAAMERLHQARKALQEGLSTPGATPATIEQRIQEVATAQTELIRLRAHMQLEINQVFTPAQLNNLKEFRESMQNLQREFGERRRSLIKQFAGQQLD